MHPLIKYFIVALLYAIPVLTGYAQEQGEELAKKLKKEYKENSFVALETSTEVEFIMNKKTSRPAIIKKENLKLITLKDYAYLVYSAGYDDHSEVAQDYVARDSKKKPIYGIDKVCGNYEVNNIFYSDAKVCTFRVPLSAFGSTNEFGISTRYDDVKYFTKQFFHEQFPSESRTITFIVPSWMEVDLMEVNFEGYKISRSRETDTKNNTIRYIYKMSKVKGFDNEEHTKGICHQYPHILVLSKAFTANAQKNQVLSCPKDLYTWYHDLTKEVDNNSATLKEQVSGLIKDKAGDEEKIKSIYYWVQDNIRYIAFEQGIAAYKPEPASKVYANRYGDCKGMANLTKEMLKLAGYDARLTWIGTNNLPYSCQVPSLAVNNHMICTVLLGGKKYILDPTEKFVALGDYAERIQGKDIMIENGDSFLQDKVPVYGKERNLTSITTALEMDGTSLKGQAEMILKGESKKDFLYELDMTSSKDKDKLFKYLASYGENKNLQAENIKTSSLDQRESDLKVNYTFKIDNQISSFNNEVYLDMDPYKQYRMLKIDTSRINDYDFGRKIFIKDVYKVKLADGYQVKYLPTGMDQKSDEFSMKISYRQEKNSIVLEKEISVDKGWISKKNFTSWNSMLRDLVKCYNDQIVLIKTK